MGQPDLLGGLLGQPGPTTVTVSTKYLHKDHLGSVVLITGQTGTVLERYSYDAWGKRRNLNGTDYTANGGHLLGETDRGFTGHEHLDHLGLVHMNGRIYDASLGRFMSADPFIAQPANLQNYNRYAYVNNNPLSYTDPTGFFLKKLFKNKIFRIAVAIGVGFYTGYYNFGTALAPSYGVFGASSLGLSGGFAAFGNSVVSGASIGGISSGSLKGALNGGITAGLTWGAGSIGEYAELADKGFGIAGLHAGAGCVSASLTGADCGQQALAGGLSNYLGGNIPSLGKANLLREAAIGGTVSALSGGKFANGAKTFSFVYMFSESAKFYANTVGRQANPLPGENRLQSTYKYDEITGRQYSDTWDQNVIGINQPIKGAWYSPGNFSKQGGLVSRVLNLIPTMNATAGLHDYWFNLPKPYGLEFTFANNIGTMLPAAAISVSASIGNYTQVWQSNPIVLHSLINAHNRN